MSAFMRKSPTALLDDDPLATIDSQSLDYEQERCHDDRRRSWLGFWEKVKHKADSLIARLLVFGESFDSYVNSDGKEADVVRSAFQGLVTCLAFAALLYLMSWPLSYLLPDQVAKMQAIGQSAYRNDDQSYNNFNGVSECKMSLSSMYTLPILLDQSTPFCKSRVDLLEALSEGGRYGFDAPYAGRGCTYQWYSAQEICMVMARMSSVVFIGDDVARNVYMGLNILLQQDFATGALNIHKMEENNRGICVCGAQFSDLDGIGCSRFAIRSSDEVDLPKSGYVCDYPPHAYISTDSSSTEETVTQKFGQLMFAKSHPWQPSPIILSFTEELDFDQTSAKLTQVQQLIDKAQRNIPVLILGPERNKYQGTTQIRAYSQALRDISKQKHYEYLGLWNMTLQSNKDTTYAEVEKMAVIQAMMVVNWLSRLPTS